MTSACTWETCSWVWTAGIRSSSFKRKAIVLNWKKVESSLSVGDELLFFSQGLVHEWGNVDWRLTDWLVYLLQSVVVINLHFYPWPQAQGWWRVERKRLWLQAVENIKKYICSALDREVATPPHWKEISKVLQVSNENASWAPYRLGVDPCYPCCMDIWPTVLLLRTEGNWYCLLRNSFGDYLISWEINAQCVYRTDCK